MPFAPICWMINDCVYFVHVAIVVLIKNQLFIEFILAFVVFNRILMDNRQIKKRRNRNAAKMFWENRSICLRQHQSERSKHVVKGFHLNPVFSSVWYFFFFVFYRMYWKHLVNTISDKRVCLLFGCVIH